MFDILSGFSGNKMATGETLAPAVQQASCIGQLCNDQQKTHLHFEVPYCHQSEVAELSSSVIQL
jgi:hypothetical protein